MKEKKLFARRSIRAFVVCVLLLFIWAVFLRGAFSGERLFSLYEDNEFMLGSIFYGISNIVRHGNMPIRLDEILGGFPLYNFTQVTAYYPFYGFLFNLYDGFWSTLKTLHFLTIFHLLFLMAGMYFLLRRVGADVVAAVVGAALFSFSEDMYAYSTWLNIIAPYSWLPLYVAGLIGLLTGYNNRINYTLILLSVCMIVTASPSQPLIHSVLLTIFLLLGFILHCIYTKKISNCASVLVRLIGIAIICGLVCAPILLSASVEASKMIRWIGNFPAIMLNERVPFNAFVYYKLPLADFWRIFFHYDGGLVGGAYIGFFAVPLVAFAFLRGATWLPLTLLVTASYSLLSAFGDDLGFAYINHKIPLLNKIREPSRNLALFQFCIAILCSLGITNIAKMLRSGEPLNFRGNLLLIISCSIVTLAYVYGFLCFRDGALVENVFGNYYYQLYTADFVRYAICILMLIATVAAIRARSSVIQHFVIFGWPAAALISLFTAVSWQPKLTISDSLYVRDNYATLEMAIIDVRQRDQSANYRVLFDGDIDKGRAAMLATYHGVRSFTYYINPAPIRQAVDFEWHGYSPYYSYLGASYLICKRCDIAQYRNHKLLASYGEYKVYGDSNAYPRIYSEDIVGDYFDTNDFINKVKNEPSVGNRRAYIEKVSNSSNYHKSTSGACQIKTLKEAPNKFDVLVDCAPGVAIVLNEYNDGNWLAKINGKLVQTNRVNANQVGVFSIGGTQFISFEYYPSLFYHSFYLSIFGVLLFVALIFFSPRSFRNRDN